MSRAANAVTRPLHIVIDEAAFTELVAGRRVELEDGATHEKVRVILSDMGFARMSRAIGRAETDQRRRSGAIPSEAGR